MAPHLASTHLPYVLRLLRRYARLYNAAIKDSAFGYAIFFAGFFANLVFSIWSAVGELPVHKHSWCACAGTAPLALPRG